MTLNCNHCSQSIGVKELSNAVDLACPHCGVSVAPTFSMMEEGRDNSISKLLKELLPVDAVDSDMDVDEKAPRTIVDVLGSGGMGVVVTVRDSNVMRDVAMKVLHGKMTDPSHVYRFVQEARLTGQLEHPNVVPVHELSLDASGNVFYTMKRVEGMTVKQIVSGLRKREPEVVARFDFHQLLRIFMKMCDAIAFAHDRGIIHRDLKPGNVIVGKYGEVYVLDWGLAKKIHEDDVEVTDSPVEDSNSDTFATMDGVVLGTPGYMSPEQVMGANSKTDERVDVYGLGGILYTLLTLRTPVVGKTVNGLLSATLRGEIMNPYAVVERYRKDGRYDFLPDARLPKSLVAVALHALSLKVADRYSSVKELQADVDDYQAGFATRAERASFGRRLRLMVQRRRKEFAWGGGLALLLILSTVLFGLRVKLANGRVEVAAQTSHRHAETSRNNAISLRTAIEELRNTAPMFSALAMSKAGHGDLESSKSLITQALELDPGSTSTRLSQAYVLILEEKFQDAKRVLEDAYPEGDRPEMIRNRLATLTDLLRANPDDVGSLLCHTYLDWGLPSFAVIVMNRHSIDHRKQFEIYEAVLRRDGWVVMLDGLESGGIVLTKTGGEPITNLNCLTGFKLVGLDVHGEWRLSDISALKGMALTQLDVSRSSIRDVTVLKGMPLTRLVLANTDVVDVEPLRGMPLTHLDLEDTRVSDLRPLEGMSLTTIVLDPEQIIHGMEVLRGMTSLKEITFEMKRYKAKTKTMTPERFWTWYDSGNVFWMKGR